MCSANQRNQYNFRKKDNRIIDHHLISVDCTENKRRKCQTRIKNDEVKRDDDADAVDKPQNIFVVH